MYLSICFFIVLSWLFAGAERGKMKLLLLRYIYYGAAAGDEPESYVMSDGDNRRFHNHDAL
jgi:hypothetical protein